jgi:RP/EB family microtubule-associated protein
MAGYYRGRQVTSVGWKALLEWVNDVLKLHLTQIEQCASGAVYCQILDMCYPETVEMSKVNWLAKAEHEHIPNYKVLQTACDANGINKQFPVGELIRGKFRDNFEMLQWMKALWDRVGAQKLYNPCKAREGKHLPCWAGGVAATVGTPRSRSMSRSRELREKTIPTPCRAPSAVAKVDTWRAPESASSSKVRSRSASREPDLKQRLAAQDDESTLLRQSRDDEITLLRQERDFYFAKLSSAESLCKSLEASDDPQVSALIKQFQQILYKDHDGDSVTTERSREDDKIAAAL